VISESRFKGGFTLRCGPTAPKNVFSQRLSETAVWQVRLSEVRR